MGHLDSQRSLPVIGDDKPGFSPMAKKLRLAADDTVAILNAPPDYIALLTPGPAEIRSELEPGVAYDVVQLFVKDADELRRLGPAAVRAVEADGLLWITYPKGSATRGPTDLPATPGSLPRDVL